MGGCVAVWGEGGRSGGGGGANTVQLFRPKVMISRK